MSLDIDTADEIFDVVDQADRVIGRATRAEVHRNPALIHRAVHILVFRPDGRLLMQRRSAVKDIDPGLWDTSVGGHVDAGEDYLTAARRELSEELGIEGLPLRQLYDQRYRSAVETEAIRTFRAEWSGPVRPHPIEITEVRDWTRDEIAAAIGRGNLTKNFEQEWRTYCAWESRQQG
jgi:isopentenyl-diphosphate delta-isomerase type 1